jgi:predicted transcriptional regulator
MSDSSDSAPDGDDGQGPRERLEQEADRAKSGFDDGLVDILSWVLDTETRARIYVYLRQHPWSTSEEVAEGTGLYPSTVREALAELADEDTVERRKRESEGAGNNPYEYTAIAPSDLVGGVVGRVQDELNTVFNLDAHLGKRGDSESESESEAESGPVRIEVEEGTNVEAEVGDSDAELDVDVEAGAEVSEDGTELDVGVEAEGEAGEYEADVEAEGEIGHEDESEDADEKPGDDT